MNLDAVKKQKKTSGEVTGDYGVTGTESLKIKMNAFIDRLLSDRRFCRLNDSDKPGFVVDVKMTF